MPNLTPAEESLILAALNHYWNYCSNELQKKPIGDIEKAILTSDLLRTKDLIMKLE